MHETINIRQKIKTIKGESSKPNYRLEIITFARKGAYKMFWNPAMNIPLIIQKSKILFILICRQTLNLCKTWGLKQFFSKKLCDFYLFNTLQNYCKSSISTIHLHEMD